MTRKTISIVLLIVVAAASFLGYTIGLGTACWDEAKFKGAEQFETLEDLEAFVYLLEVELGEKDAIDDLSVNSPLTVKYSFYNSDTLDWPYDATPHHNRAEDIALLMVGGIVVSMLLTCITSGLLEAMGMLRGDEGYMGGKGV